MKFSVIALPLVILIDILVFVNFFKWYQESVYEFEQRQMDLQVNYSIEAAVQEMLRGTASIETGYVNWKEMKVDPVIAYDTYLAVLLKNFGWADNVENRVALEDSSIPFFCVAAYDGYYILLRQKEIVTQTVGGQTVNNSTYPLRWTPKIPYSYKSGNNLYGFNLNYDNYLKLSEVGSKEITLYAIGDAGITKSLMRQTVSSILSEACNSALFLGMEGRTNVYFYIPSEMTSWQSSNPIEGPSCITYLMMNNGTVQFDTVTFAIGGAKISEANFCIAYMKNGIKMYTYSFNRDKLSGATNIIKIYATPKEAALDGYYFDNEFLK